MWAHTSVARRIGIEYPIIQGPFGGGLSSIQLTVAVSEAGGMGSFGVHHLGPDDIGNIGRKINAQTKKPFALNLWVSNHDEGATSFTPAEYARALDIFQPYYRQLNIEPPSQPARFGYSFEEQIEAVLDIKPAAFSFVYGIPSDTILEECRRRNIVTIGTITTIDEAVAMENAGVDLIVATGFEAGGHRVSFLQSSEDSLTGTFALIQTVTASVKTPVIAAGGIANAKSIAAAMILGAQGVQIGTAFLACSESNASDIHRAKLFSDDAKYTVLTRAFSGRLARGIRNNFTDEWQAKNFKPLPYPIQSWFTNSFKSAAINHQRPDMMSLWASQITPLLKHKQAKELFDELVQNTNSIFNRNNIHI
ncbi:MAG TPA: nitronate monooxygenase [Cellvibrio sp.]|nr:nitronate monooxygenase [Cellvibrio sp.]